MRHSFSGRVLAAGLLLPVALAVACGRPSTSPLTPGPLPSHPLQPSVTSLSPITGATGGGASVTIVGSGFHRETIVLFDGVPVGGRFDTRDQALTRMYLQAPSHAPGPVDVVVANPDGASTRISAGYTYVPAGSFNANGAWYGGAFDGSDRGLAFTIENNAVRGVTCFGATGETRLEFPEPIRVVESEFSFVTSDGVVLSGRMVAPDEMIGTMNLSPCTAMSWRGSPAQ
jgi:hypothetical protein